MDQFYSDCLDRFAVLHNEIKKSFRGLSIEALDWVPAADANSISVLVTHLAAAERYWAVDAALGKTSTRVRPEEFLVKQLSEKDLISKLDSTFEEITSAYQDLEMVDLSVMRQSENRDTEFTSGWAILHALEHTALHLGHLQLTAQWWKEREGSK
jgi:hypothetical protein